MAALSAPTGTAIQDVGNGTARHVGSFAYSERIFGKHHALAGLGQAIL